MKQVMVANKIKELRDEDYELFWKFYDQIEFESRLFGNGIVTFEDIEEWEKEAYERLIRYKNKLPERFV